MNEVFEGYEHVSFLLDCLKKCTSASLLDGGHGPGIGGMLVGGAAAAAVTYGAHQLTSTHGHGCHNVSHGAQNMIPYMGGMGHFSGGEISKHGGGKYKVVGYILGEIMTRKPLFPGRDYVHEHRLITKLIRSPNDASLGFLRSDNARRYLRHLAKYPRQQL